MAFNNFLEKNIGNTDITRGDAAAVTSLVGAVTVAGLIMVSPGLQERIGGPFAKHAQPTITEIMNEVAQGSAYTDSAPRQQSSEFDYNFREGPAPTDYRLPNWMIEADRGFEAGRVAVCDVFLPEDWC